MEMGTTLRRRMVCVCSNTDHLGTFGGTLPYLYTIARSSGVNAAVTLGERGRCAEAKETATAAENESECPHLHPFANGKITYAVRTFRKKQRTIGYVYDRAMDSRN